MNFKCFPIVFAVMLLSFASKGQGSIDSLKQLLNESKQKGEMKRSGGLLAAIGWEFYLRSNFDSALIYFRRAVQVGKSSKDPDFFASAYANMGVSYGQLGQPDSSIVYYEKALKLYEDQKDTSKSVSVETNLAILYKNLGLYEASLERSFSALSKIESKPPDRTLASCYNTIGSVYASINDNENALKYYYQALRVRTAINYLKGIGQSHNNLGEVYLVMHEYDSALGNLLKAVDMKRKANDIKGLYSTINKLGEVVFELHLFSQAEDYFRESLVLSRSNKELRGEIIALHNLALVKITNKAYQQADLYLSDADRLVQKIGALDLKKRNLELKVQMSKATGNAGLAFRASEQLLVIKDSLLNNEKIESLNRLQTRYDTEKKQQQIDLLEKNKAFQQLELESNSRWMLALIMIIVLAMIIGFLLVIGYRASQRNERRVETLLRELHHRVKNNLQILSSLFSMQSQQLKDEDAIKAIKSSESRVNTMALLHKKLYRDENNTSINIREYAAELTQFLMHTYGYSPETLRVSIVGDDLKVDVDKAIPIGLIINELVSNALKYAYAGQSSPTLTVQMQVDALPVLSIVIADNGIGLQNKNDNNSSFGLTMVRTLVKELRGKLDVSTQSGTEYKLFIPLY